LQIGRIALGVAIGVAGGTLIADSSAGRLGVWSVPLALVVVGVSIALYGMLEPYKDQRRAKILRGMIALVFLVDVVCLAGSCLGTDVAAAVAFWRRGSGPAHILVIMLVAFGVDPFLKQKRR
jgi:predicted permease